MHACIVLVGVESDGRLIRCQVFYRMEVKGGGGDRRNTVLDLEVRMTLQLITSHPTTPAHLIT